MSVISTIVLLVLVVLTIVQVMRISEISSEIQKKNLMEEDDELIEEEKLCMRMFEESSGSGGPENTLLSATVAMMEAHEGHLAKRSIAGATRVQPKAAEKRTSAVYSPSGLGTKTRFAHNKGATRERSYRNFC